MMVYDKQFGINDMSKVGLIMQGEVDMLHRRVYKFRKQVDSLALSHLILAL
jgi:hypothetical protein